MARQKPQSFFNFSALTFSLLASSTALSGLAMSLLPARAQIMPAADGTGTIVNVNGNTFNITGGTQAGGNLFHSFQQMGLSQEQIANFMSNPSIQNILGRVTGGDPSVLNGLIQVTGGNSNLFLMNPAGIIFGPNARLDVPAAFTATTANGIGIGNGMFSASGPVDYSKLTGDPNSFVFTMENPGAIVNQGKLAVKDGQSLVLTAGTVVSPGKLEAPNGQILVTAMPGQSRLLISVPGSPLSLEVPKDWNASISSLNQLLSGAGSNVSGVTVDADGTVHLTGSNFEIKPGDVVAQNASAQQVTISASNNLILAPIDNTKPAKMTANNTLTLSAGNQVIVRDTVEQSFAAKSGGNLTVIGNKGIDIWALKHLDQGQAFQSLGDMKFISDGIISGDAHFAAKGSISYLNRKGEAGTFVSYYDPIISSNQDVRLGNYTGASLKIETLGSIYAGDITITTPDVGLTGSDPDISILTSRPALILRSGLTSLANPVNLNTQNLLMNTGGTVANVLYKVNDLGTAGGVSATGDYINSAGTVAGTSYSGSNNTGAQASLFPLSASGFRTGVLPGYIGSVAYGIGDNGVVGITQISPSGNGRASAYYPGYGLYDLGGLPGGTGVSAVYGMSGNGYFTGIASDSSGEGHLVYWTPSGVISDLGTGPINGFGTRAWQGLGINNSGQMTGQAYTITAGTIVYDSIAFIRGSTGLATISPLPGDSQSFGTDINNLGVVVGTSFNGSYDFSQPLTNGQAFIYRPGIGVSAIGMLPGDSYSGANTVNDNHVALGYSGNASTTKAVIFSNGAVIDVNSLIIPGSGYALTNAGEINNNGQIAATGTFNGSQNRAIRLDPSVTPNGGISVGHITTAGGPVILDGPKVELRGNITTNGGNVLLQQNAPVTLNSATGTVTIATQGGNITLNGPIDGNQNLTIDAASGAVDFNGAVGNTTALNTLTVTGSHLKTNDTTVTGNLTLISDAIDLAGPIRQAQTLSLQPKATGSNIGIGTTPATGGYELSAQEMSRIQSGVGLTVIGNPNGTGTVELALTQLNTPTEIVKAHTFKGPNLDMDWQVTGADTIVANNHFPLGLSVNTTNVIGGSGHDRFRFSPNGSITGNLHGGGGSNTLDYLNYFAPVTVQPGARTAGTATGVGGTILGFSEVIGFANSNNTLKGQDLNTTWQLTGTAAGSVDEMNFTNFDILRGGPGNDRFVQQAGVSFLGIVYGGNGQDSLDLSSYTTPVTVDLGLGAATGISFREIEQFVGPGVISGNSEIVGANTNNNWQITGNHAGSVNGMQFEGFQRLVGGSRVDTFTLVNGMVNDIHGRGGEDTLSGDNALSNTVTLTAYNQGTLSNDNGTLSFASIENLQGGAQADTFNIQDGGLSSLNGKGGNDTLSYANNSNFIIVDLGDGNTSDIGTVSGFENYVGNHQARLIGTDGNDQFIVTGQGDGTMNGVSFTDFSELRGGWGDDTFTFEGGMIPELDGGDGFDQLVGDSHQSNQIVLTGLNQGILSNGNGTNHFYSIESLNGGAQQDTFQIQDGGSLSGNLNGGLGNDTFSYEHYSNPVTVDLGSSQATGINGTVTSLENWVGNGSQSQLIGTAVADTFTITGPSRGTINGTDTFTHFNSVNAADGDDTFTYKGGMIPAIDGGTGNDQLMGDPAQPNQIALTDSDRGTITNANGTGNFTSIENLTGGNQADTIQVHPGGLLSGHLNGSGGSDTLDYSNYPHDVTVNLQTGDATAFSNGMSSIENLIGSTGKNDTLIGSDQTNDWNITGPDRGTVTTAGHTTTFADFENLNGGNNQDTFNLKNPNSSISGLINGGNGTDTLNGRNGSTVHMTGPTSGTINGSNHFTSIEHVYPKQNSITPPIISMPILQTTPLELSHFQGLMDHDGEAHLNSSLNDDSFACSSSDETKIALAQATKTAKTPEEKSKLQKLKDKILACFKHPEQKQRKQPPPNKVEPSAQSSTLVEVIVSAATDQLMAKPAKAEHQAIDVNKLTEKQSQQTVKTEQIKTKQIKTEQTIKTELMDSSNSNHEYSNGSKPFLKESIRVKTGVFNKKKG